MPRQNADQTRDRLVREMMDLAHRQGFRATSVGDIIQAAGVTRGALYHYFPSKDDLGLAALEQFAADFHQFIQEAVGERTGLDALDAFFRAALDKHRGRCFVGGCPFGNTALEMADADPRYAAMVSAVFRHWTSRLADALSEAQAAGQVRDDLAAEHLATLLVAIIEGSIMLSRLEKQEDPMKDCLATVRTLLTHGASPPRP